MVNEEIARLFDRMAKVLAFKGADRFRILAYERGANSIRDLREDLRSMPPESFKEIPAIGKDLAAMTAEYLDTGRMARYENERRGIPDQLIDLMSVPGLGPKTLAALHERLKVKSLEDLERELAGTAILGLPGFGEKKVANLRESLATWEGGRDRMSIGVALPLAEELLRRVSESKLVDRAELAGSIRRGKETIADIDVLVSSGQSASALAGIARLPGIQRVTALGDTRLSMVIEGGVQVDVRAVPAESYGAALQYFTGSKEHNVHLRTLGRERSLKINEYGVFRGERRIGGGNEEDVYAALGLPLIVPELREDRGEIEAAQRGKLPALIEAGDLRGDLHVHTDYSDGRATVEEMVESGAALHYKYIALSDHSPSQRVARGLALDRLEAKIEHLEKLRRARRGKPPEILMGAEVDILPDGALDYPDSVLKRLDVVIAAVHGAFGQTQDRMTGRLLAALDNPYVRVLAHPMARLLGARKPVSFDFDRLVAKAASQRVALEINGSYLRLDLNDAMARAAAQAGCLLSIGSDAHTTSQLERVRFGILQGRRGWVAPGRVVNTWGLAKLRQWLASK